MANSGSSPRSESCGKTGVGSRHQYVWVSDEQSTLAMPINTDIFLVVLVFIKYSSQYLSYLVLDYGVYRSYIVGWEFFSSFICPSACFHGLRIFRVGQYVRNWVVIRPTLGINSFYGIHIGNSFFNSPSQLLLSYNQHVTLNGSAFCFYVLMRNT